MLFICIVY